MNKKPIALLILCLLLAGCEMRDPQQVRDEYSPVVKEKPPETKQADLPAVSEDEAVASQDEDLEKMGATMDDVTGAFLDGYHRLIDTRNVIAAYCSDESVANREEMLAGVNRADSLIDRIDAEDIDSLTASQIAGYFDEMADVMDVLTKVNSSQEQKKVNEKQLRESLANTIWIDDDTNTYMFDRNGRNMYLALAGDDKPFGGTYTIKGSKRSVEFTFTIPNLKTEVKAEVTRFDDRAFCFTDQNTGDEFYLMPVKRQTP